MPKPCEPTPEEIRAMCEEIQKEWSAEERARRASGRSHGDGKLTETGWTVPVVRLNINAK